jgi:hypothetical protein
LIPQKFANISSGNLQVQVFALTADNGASSFLVAGNYLSTITITVTPTS